MADVFLQKDVCRIFHNKYIVFMGSSVERSMYKDFIKLLQGNDLLTDAELRKKGESSILGDELLQGGCLKDLTNGIKYREVRQFKTDYYLVKFHFVTRCYSDYVESILETLDKDPIPDVVLMGSALWDLTRYGPNSVPQYQEDIKRLFGHMFSKLHPVTQVIWLTCLPVSQFAKGGVFVPEVEYLLNTTRLETHQANLYCANMASSHGFDVLDICYFLRHHLHRRAEDGIHWDMSAHRRITNLIVTHVSLSWGFSLPGCSADDTQRGDNQDKSVSRPEMAHSKNTNGRRHDPQEPLKSFVGRPLEIRKIKPAKRRRPRQESNFRQSDPPIGKEIAQGVFEIKSDLMQNEHHDRLEEPPLRKDCNSKEEMYQNRNTDFPYSVRSHHQPSLADSLHYSRETNLNSRVSNFDDGVFEIVDLSKGEEVFCARSVHSEFENRVDHLRDSFFDNSEPIRTNIECYTGHQSNFNDFNERRRDGSERPRDRLTTDDFTGDIDWMNSSSFLDCENWYGRFGDSRASPDFRFDIDCGIQSLPFATMAGENDSYRYNHIRQDNQSPINEHFVPPTYTDFRPRDRTNDLNLPMPTSDSSLAASENRYKSNNRYRDHSLDDRYKSKSQSDLLKSRLPDHFSKSSPPDRRYKSNSQENLFKSNSLDDRNRSNSLDDRYKSSPIDDRCKSNSMDDRYKSNSLGDRYKSTSLDDRYKSNSLDDRYKSNSLGDRYKSNSMDARYKSNSMDDRYKSHLLDDRCHSNSHDQRYDRNSQKSRYKNNSSGDRFTSYSVTDETSIHGSANVNPPSKHRHGPNQQQAEIIESGRYPSTTNDLRRHMNQVKQVKDCYREQCTVEDDRGEPNKENQAPNVSHSRLDARESLGRRNDRKFDEGGSRPLLNHDASPRSLSGGIFSSNRLGRQLSVKCDSEDKSAITRSFGSVVDDVMGAIHSRTRNQNKGYWETRELNTSVPKRIVFVVDKEDDDVFQEPNSMNTKKGLSSAMRKRLNLKSGKEDGFNQYSGFSVESSREETSVLAYDGYFR